MKTFVVLILVAAVVACGGAFFGLFTIPGMENFPTVESLGKNRQHSIESEAQKRFEGSAGSSAWGKKPTGRLGTRSGQLNKAEGSLK